jgi:murein L,D-transpeptidase YcbB/YkuD
MRLRRAFRAALKLAIESSRSAVVRIEGRNVPLVVSVSRLLLVAAWSLALTDQPPTVVPPPPPSPPLSVEDGQAIVHMLKAASDQGLAAPDVSADAAMLAGDPGRRTQAEARLANAATLFAADEHGRVRDPTTVDANFALAARYDAVADFARARSAGKVGAWAAGLLRHDPNYLGLAAERRRYAAIVGRGGWRSIPDGVPPSVGAKDPRAPALRQRLALEGYASAAPRNPKVFDASLAAALADFQAHHGLAPDSAWNAATLQALNVSAAARLASLDANLERARWLPDSPPDQRIEVDLAGPTATLFQAGKPALTMKAIVGERTKKTPSFAATVTAVKFNPPWYVPRSIAAHELYPKEHRHPGYFRRNGFYVSNGQLIQRAGPKAALGYIKFEVSDPFGVYLHDTPSRSLFSRDARWLSHGCMRLENPRDLAAALLAPQGWTRADVDAAIEARTTRTVALQVQPTVYVVYRTVEVAADGRARFRPDVYGWDPILADALAGRRSEGPKETVGAAAP